jgi:tetratricopeptide (TPR) repeat protein
MRSDIAKVEKIAPDLPELTLAKLQLLPSTAYGKRLDLLARAAEKAPNKSEVFADQSVELQRVGRMADAVTSARRAAELYPLSPSATTRLIMTLAYAGQLDAAREELARAEKLWAGTGALRDTLWAFHLRFGDPALAREYAPSPAEGLDLYLNARADPTPANVEKLTNHMLPYLSRDVSSGQLGWAMQALGEFNRIDYMLGFIARAPAETVAEKVYLLFRPALRPLREDPRFMAVAKRIGLTAYWRSSGEWPDFCSDPQLPYDCKAEAAKHG